MPKRDRPGPAESPAVQRPPEAGPMTEAASVHLRQGWRLYASGDSQGASLEAQRAAQTAPSDPEAPYLLGMALKAAGDGAGAAAAFHQAASLAASEGDASRTTMLRRLAVGQANWLETGNWDLEPETWIRT